MKICKNHRVHGRTLRHLSDSVHLRVIKAKVHVISVPGVGRFSRSIVERGFFRNHGQANMAIVLSLCLWLARSNLVRVNVFARSRGLRSACRTE